MTFTPDWQQVLPLCEYHPNMQRGMYGLPVAWLGDRVSVSYMLAEVRLSALPRVSLVYGKDKVGNLLAIFYVLHC